MRKFIFQSLHTLFYGSLFLAATATLIADSLTYEKLAISSDLWPAHIKVMKDTQSKGFQNERSVPEGTTGLLIRVEGGLAVIDTGRDGIARVALEDTNIMQEATASLSGNGSKTYSIMHAMLGNKMVYWDATGELASSDYDDTLTLNYYLLLHSPSSLKHAVDLVALLKPHYETWRKGGIEVILMSVEPTRSAQHDYLKNSGMPWKTIQHSMLAGYNRSFDLPIENLPCAFLLDKNGRIESSAQGMESFETIIQKIDELASIRR